MKNYSFLLAFAFILSLSSCSKKDIASTTQESISISTVDQFLTDWHQAAADADYEAYFSPIASQGIYVGTDESEVWTKEEFSSFSKPYFDKGRAWDFKAIQRNIYQQNEQSFYFNETLDTWMGVCRGSGIIQVNESTGELEILQYVLSLTIPNESIREVMRSIEETEESLVKP